MLLKEYKRVICEIGALLHSRHMIAGGDGNISFRAADGTIWITPAGVNKWRMTPDMLLHINANGDVLSGTGRPSSEVKLHLVFYSHRADIQAVVHAHPQLATALTVADIKFENKIITESLAVLGEVATAPYGPPATDRVIQGLLPLVADHQVLLMAHHGAVAVGGDLWQAYNRMETLEHTAKIYFYARLLGAATAFGQKQEIVMNLIDTKEDDKR